MRIRVLECALDGEDSGVFGLLSSPSQDPVELRQLAIGVVGDDPNFLSSSQAIMSNWLMATMLASWALQSVATAWEPNRQAS